MTPRSFSYSKVAALGKEPSEPFEKALVAITLVVMALALLRTMLMVFPEIYWDVDPRSSLNNQPLTGIGPVACAWLDMLSVLAAAIAMFVHHHAQGRLALKSSILAVIGAAVCLWQLPRYGPGMITAGAWLAGVSLAVAALHLAQHTRPRLLITAILVAVLIPWFTRSVVYVYWDHAQTLAMFLKDEARSVESHGWTFGSPQHLLFKRRLMFPDATGWIGLSNIFGSLVACGSLISASLAVSLLAGRRYTMAIVPVVCALLGLFSLYLTHSKGAAVALVMGLGLLALVVMSWRWARLKSLIAPAALVCIALAIGLVLARGAMGPPDSDQGERSLLFRYHYWQASAGMMAGEPWSAKLLGVGPGQYKDIYSQYKNPLNPEQVTSAHNVEIDLITMLGLGGAAWSVMLLGWLWIAGRSVSATSKELTTSAEAVDEDDTSAGISDREVWVALVAAALLFAYPAYAMLEILLSTEQFVSFSLSAIMFVVVVAILTRPHMLRHAAINLALFTGAAVLLIHNQIEMSFFNMQASPLVFVIVAAAAGSAISMTGGTVNKKGEREQSEATNLKLKSIQPLAMSAVLFAGAMLMAFSYVRPVMLQDKALRDAATLIQGNHLEQSVLALDTAIKAVPGDPRPYDDKVMILRELALGAYMSQVFDSSKAAHSRRYISEALVTLDDAFAAGLDDVSLIRRRAQLLEEAGRMFDEPGRTNTAINVWESVMQRTPGNARDSLHLADLLWDQQRRSEAIDWYRKTLVISENGYLDPATQLTAEQLKHISDRLAE